MSLVKNVTAVLKDIKVTKKGITINFENVKLQGEELTQLAELIGEVVHIGVEVPQMDLFEDEDVNQAEPEENIEYDGEVEPEPTPEEPTEAPLQLEGEVVAEVEAVEEAELVDVVDTEFTPQPLYTEEEVLKELEL